MAGRLALYYTTLGPLLHDAWPFMTGRLAFYYKTLGLLLQDASHSLKDVYQLIKSR
jgi:hypothetical protein